LIYDIEKWIHVFREYGFYMENVRYVKKDGTFKAVAIEQEEEVLLSLERPALLPTDMIVLSDTEHTVSENANLPEPLKEVYNQYLDFILSEERILRQEQMFENFRMLPESCRNILLRFGMEGFFVKRTRRQLKVSLISSRTIVSDGKIYLMPFIDLLDHDYAEGIAYSVGENSVRVKGKASASGEIYAVYSGVADSFSILKKFAFASESHLAFSMAMKLSLGETLQLSIGRDLHQYEIVGERIVLPKYRVENNRIILSHLWIGSDMDRENAYKSFKILWEERLGLTEAFKVYSSIEKFNNAALDSLRRECDAVKTGIAADMVKKCALEQQRIIEGSTAGCNSLHR